MENQENQFSKETIIGIFTDNIEQYKGLTIEAMYDDLFNNDLYIIGLYNATEALNNYKTETSYNYGVFGAFDDIITYISNEIGYDSFEESVELVKELYSSPEKTATILAQCIADYWLREILDKTFDLNLDTTITDKVINQFNKAANSVENSNNYFLKY